MQKTPYQYIDNQLAIIREQIVNRVLAIIAILGLPTIGSILFRDQLIGISTTSNIQLIAYFLIVLVVILKKRVPFSIRINLVLITGIVLGVTSLYSHGLISLGLLRLMTFSILAVTLLGRKQGILAILISLSVIGIFGSLAITGIISYDFNESVYNVSFISWLVAFTGFGLFVTLIATAITDTQSALKNTLKKYISQQVELEKKIEESDLLLKSMVNRELRMRDLKEEVREIKEDNNTTN